MAKKQHCDNPHYIRMSDEAIFCENCGEIRETAPHGYREHIHWGWYPEYVKPWWVQPVRPLWYTTSTGGTSTFTPTFTLSSGTTNRTTLSEVTTVDI